MVISVPVTRSPFFRVTTSANALAARHTSAKKPPKIAFKTHLRKPQSLADVDQRNTMNWNWLEWGGGETSER